jgi:type IV pilus assembly protein PilA
MKNQKGFSLVELLVVVIIIAIIAAIAIPSLLASRRAANEASAISSLRTIHSAQATYFGTTGLNTSYADALGPVATAGSLAELGLIDPTLGAGAKSGYTFVNNSGAGVYCTTATATAQGSTGTRSFGVSQPGVIYSFAAAIPATACPDTGIFSTTGGTAIQ